MVVTTYDALLKDECLRFIKKTDWNYLVLDEAHKLKNTEAMMTRKTATIKSDNRLLMTGTPLQNNIGELWTMLDMLMPKLF